jgi:riboflavin synthase
MFTGIITDVGTVRSAENSEAGRRLSIQTKYETHEFDLGASISCGGICLTVVEAGPRWFAVDVSPETVSVTTVGSWQVGDRINLEQALKVGDELGGHIVLGHVDGTGTIDALKDVGEYRRLQVELIGEHAELAKFIARKGSIGLNGVSLTTNRVSLGLAEKQCFDVNVIPHTLTHTDLGDLTVGSPVNLEIDLMARYAARLGEFDRHKARQ